MRPTTAEHKHYQGKPHQVIEPGEMTLFLDKKKGRGVIVFRGDNRPPSVLFAFGLQRRAALYENWEALTPANAHPMWRPCHGDIDPESAVCATLSCFHASIFPLNTQVISTYIYAVIIEAGFDTLAQQKQAGFSHLRFLQEKCCYDIPRMHVLGAIRCERRWQGEKWFQGMTCKFFGPIYRNSAAQGTVGLAKKSEKIEADFRGLIGLGDGVEVVEPGGTESRPKVLYAPALDYTNLPDCEIRSNVGLHYSGHPG